MNVLIEMQVAMKRAEPIRSARDRFAKELWAARKANPAAARLVRRIMVSARERLICDYVAHGFDSFIAQHVRESRGPQ